MYNKLKSYSTDPIFVTLTVEVVAGITVYIAEDELSGKKEVAKWGIEMIQVPMSFQLKILKSHFLNFSNGPSLFYTYRIRIYICKEFIICKMI